MRSKERIFFYHYNKPASLKAGKPQITIHYKNACLLVDNLICDVPTWGYLKKDQPRFVVKGKCKEIEIIDGIGYIR